MQGRRRRWAANDASMKALPKRKGNYFEPGFFRFVFSASMKALPKRKGNWRFAARGGHPVLASMKALPKRKGNTTGNGEYVPHGISLNESPSEKEGK